MPDMRGVLLVVALVFAACSSEAAGDAAAADEARIAHARAVLETRVTDLCNAKADPAPVLGEPFRRALEVVRSATYRVVADTVRVASVGGYSTGIVFADGSVSGTLVGYALRRC
jgi:hypothetical protein